MKPLLVLSGLCLTALGASAQVVENYTLGFENNGVIAAGNVNPWSDTESVFDNQGSIGSVTVRLDVSSGYNGDFYAYLSHGGVMVPLLNRVGIGTGNACGYSDGGLNVSFSDSAANNIHFYQNVSGYSISGGALWQPDGRTLNPVTSSPSSFDAPGSVTLASFQGLNPNGNWTLVVADLSGGGPVATLLSWGLTISPVPEPASVSLVVGAALGIFGFVRRFRRSVT
jgi:hypothetical protein